MIYLKKIIIIICILVLATQFAKKNLFWITIKPYPNQFSTEIIKEQICPKELQITPYLISLFYDISSIKSLRNMDDCLIANDIRLRNNMSRFFPDSLFENYIEKHCQSPSFNRLSFIFENKKQTLYRTKNQKQLCRTQTDCFTIIKEKKDILILNENDKRPFFFYPLEPFVYKEALQSIYPTVLEPNFQWAEFNKNIELHLVPGGLGNHLLQYWTAKIYAVQQGKKLYMTESFPAVLSDVFEITEQNVPEKAVIYSKQSPLIKQFYNSSATGPPQRIDRKNPNFVFFKGYLQSYHNLVGYEDYIRKHTKFKYPLSESNQKIAHQMSQENAVAIHIRRGDYLELDYYILSVDYYKRAINYMNRHVKNPHYYIFSNDIKWAKENLKLKEKNTFVDWNKKDYEDLHLMTKCKHFIIANSTFSWWGAFLSTYSNKIVIAPDKWIPWASYWQDDLIFPNWIRQKNVEE